MSPHCLNLGGWLAFSASGVLLTVSGTADRNRLIVPGSVAWLFWRRLLARRVAR